MSMMGYWQSLVNEWIGKVPYKNKPWETKEKTIPFPSENPIIGKCSKCGLELHQAMWYVCSNYPCPTGLGRNIHL